MRFDDLIGKTVDFYGVDNACFCLGLGDQKQVFEAVEDPDDGYRSMLGEIAEREMSPSYIFFGQPVAQLTVRVADGADDFDGYELVDAGGHLWLQFGTGDHSDYYPTYEFHYSPPWSATT